nr:MAG TPA: Exodeoxyribonuclease 8 [Caudoviricetes sp.]
MEAFDLNGFAEGEELNPSAYNPEDYPTKEEMLDFIYSNSHKPPVNIDLKELSVNGLVKRDPMEMYLKSKHISSSNLKNALKTPRSFYYDYERVFEEKEKPCFQLGTFAHMAFLEPRLFELVKVEPKYNQSSKEGVIGMIKFYNELLSNDENYVPDVEEEIPSERWNFSDLKDFRDYKKQKCLDLGYSFISEDMSMIIKALERNYYWYGGGIIPQLLKGAYSEVSFYGKDEETGLDVRVRPDYFNVEENIGVNAVISFKTT